MDELWQLAPDYAELIQPTTAKEAVTSFHQTTRDWAVAQWDNLPELLVKLARELTGKELDLFEEWIQNPKGTRDVAVQVPDEDDEKLLRQAAGDIMSSEQTAACSSTSPRV
jgi:hypothetical protein